MKNETELHTIYRYIWLIMSRCHRRRRFVLVQSASDPFETSRARLSVAENVGEGLTTYTLGLASVVTMWPNILGKNEVSA